MLVGDYIVTHHARERWAERGDPVDLAAALLAALPYGKRSPSHLMLRHGRSVFHVTLDAGKQIVTTVLTDDMADGNAQVFHGGRQNNCFLSASRNAARCRRYHAKVRHRLRKQSAEEE